MLGRQLAGLQTHPVGFLKPEEEGAKILAVIALRIVGKALFDLAVVQKGNKVAAQRLLHIESV